MDLSIIIPLYNEAKTIQTVVDRIQKVSFPSFVNSWEIIIVNDCSTDGSGEIIDKIAADNIHVRTVHHDVNQGKGKSVRTGAEQMKGNVLLIQDADLELHPEDIPSMLVAMHELDVLFVNGSRYLPGVIRPLYSYRRYIGNKYFSALTSILINVKITDMACGYKLITKDLYDQIDPQENRFAIEAELMLKALKIQRNIITEVPVRYLPRNKGEGKKLRTKDTFRVLYKILKIGLFWRKKKA
ncbi:MAG: glycosyltransferase family 2 protein [Crocinitomicaceae bacterium]